MGRWNIIELLAAQLMLARRKHEVCTMHPGIWQRWRFCYVVNPRYLLKSSLVGRAEGIKMKT